MNDSEHLSPLVIRRLNKVLARVGLRQLILRANHAILSLVEEREQDFVCQQSALSVYVLPFLDSPANTQVGHFAFQDKTK